MKLQTVDQEWQHLQAHIEGFFSQALANDAHKIEYKPRFIAQMLEMPSESHQDEIQDISKRRKLGYRRGIEFITDDIALQGIV